VPEAGFGRLIEVYAKIKSMKWSVLIATAIIAAAVTGCGKLDELTKFDIDYNESVTIPANTIINLPIELMSPDVETNSEEVFSQNNTQADRVESVILKNARLTITSPNGKTFSFLKSVEVYLNADGLPETKIAEKQDIDDAIGSELTLDTFGNDLSEFIKKDKFRIRVKTVTDEAITSEVHIDIACTFFVDAKILGI
jgi:hypothetical protein